MTDIWEHYWLNPDPAVGLFTLVGAILTALAVTYSARAVREAQNNTVVAKSALDKATENAQRDEFVRHFSMLLEQHNAQLEIVKRFLDDEFNAEKTKENKDKIGLLPTLSRPVGHLEAFNMLRGHSVISPYMRILYHLLKYVANDFYIKDATIEQKKKYTSVVRSLIRNDVLFLVAVNASYIRENGEKTQYAAYQQYLHDFDFFDHAIFFCPNNTNGDKEDSVIKKWHDEFVNTYSRYFTSVILSQDAGVNVSLNQSFPPAMVASYIFRSPKHDKIVNLLNDLPDSLSSIFETAKTFYHENNKFYLSIDSYFNEYIGRAVFEVPANGQTVVMGPEDYANNYQNKPVIDRDYVEAALEVYKSTGRVSDSHQFYYDQKNSHALLLSQFTDRCRDFISSTTSWEKANDGTYDPLRENNEKIWRGLVEEIQLQNLY
ncbi:putative phage abortive infection protein [Yersinia enterocolitica]|uniref:putative phage abortive infection protein n=1 Tax=Yersinia enterocolitica TaxID=630 RepID=UPI00398D5695